MLARLFRLQSTLSPSLRSLTPASFSRPQQTRSPTAPRLLLRAPLNIRTMASSSEAPKHEWLVIIPDFDGALEKRLAVRPYVFAFAFLPFPLSFFFCFKPPASIRARRRRTSINNGNQYDFLFPFAPISLTCPPLPKRSALTTLPHHPSHDLFSSPPITFFFFRSTPR